MFYKLIYKLMANSQFNETDLINNFDKLSDSDRQILDRYFTYIFGQTLTSICKGE